MQKLISLNVLFLGISFFAVQSMHAAENGAKLGLPDVTSTPSRAQMEQFKELLLGKPTLDLLDAHQELSVQFSGAADGKSERALLGKLFTVQRELLKAQKALKDAMSEHSIENQGLDELAARVQELEEAVDGKAGLREALKEKDQKIAELMQASQVKTIDLEYLDSDDRIKQSRFYRDLDQKKTAADSEITTLKIRNTKAKIAIGCMGAFIITDKVIIPLIRKCYTVWNKRQNRQKRPSVWAVVRSRFQKEARKDA